MDRKLIENLRLPTLPNNDTAKIGEAALTAEYDAVDGAITTHNAGVAEYLAHAAAIANDTGTGGHKALEKELAALRADGLRLALAAVELAGRRVELKRTLRAAHNVHSSKMGAILNEAEARKKEELRQFNGGTELPWHWADTLQEALSAERANTNWQPTFLLEGEFHPSDSPTARSANTLRALIVQAIGFDPAS